MQNYKMVIAYDGTRYLGWQKLGERGSKEWQKTIQGKIESILSILTGEEATIQGSGRTDAGVHAKAQVASFKTNASLSETEIRDYLNEYLPEDIAVLSVEKAAPNFHARLNAKGKTYTYCLLNSPVPDVFRQKYEYRIEEKLNVEAMKQAAAYLVGTHDFKNFCTNARSYEKKKKSTVRTLYEVSVEETPCENGIGCHITLTFKGDGFLYNMVRILTGTLIEIGLDKRSSDSVEYLFGASSRAESGYTVPPKGLTLTNVQY